ncbi:MAG: hypothetical protein OEM97_07225 [Acidimicrobiia bacterium]|nr:hypothetical protein [Acidimicrobiia bacterium]
MLDVYLMDVEEPQPDDELKLELRRAALNHEIIGLELSRRLTFYDLR